MARDVLAAARELADQVLFPDAMRIDRLDALPAAHLDEFALMGLYGAPAAPAAGGLGLDPRETGLLVEELASGCLAAAFVLIQHFRLLATLAAPGTRAQLRDRWLADARPGRPPPPGAGAPGGGRGPPPPPARRSCAPRSARAAGGWTARRRG